MKNIGVVRSIKTDADIQRWYSEDYHQLKRYDPYVFNIFYKRKKRVKRDADLKALDQFLQRDQLEFIVARPGMEAKKILPLKLKWQFPLVIDCRNKKYLDWAYAKKKSKERKKLYRVADYFFVPFFEVKERWIKEGCPEEKISVLWNGINPHDVHFQERNLNPGQKIRLLIPVSRPEKKSFKPLMKACRNLLQQSASVEVTIWDQSRHHKVEKKWKKKSDPHIRFISEISEKKANKEIERADILCIPDSNIKENLLMRMLATGLPVITYEDHRRKWGHWLKRARNTLYLSKKEKSAWISGITELIQSPEKRRKMGQKSWRIVTEWYDGLNLLQHMEELFDGLVSEWNQNVNRSPFFSVVIPTYNRKKYVKRAIKSVLKQTIDNYEVIVVDDGSNDGTRKMIESMSPRVRYIYQKNKGPSQARNSGILAARGQYIAFLDSDDRFLPRKLEKNKKFLSKNPDCMFLYGWYYDKRSGHKKKKKKPKRCKKLNEFRYRIYRREFTIRTSTVVVHRDCFKKVGLFNPKYYYAQDWDMWLRLAGRYMGYCQKEPLVIYRRHKKKKNRRKVNRIHKKIKRNAKKIFGWNKKKLNKLERKYKSKYKKKKRKQRKKKRRKQRLKKRMRRRKRRRK